MLINPRAQQRVAGFEAEGGKKRSKRKFFVVFCFFMAINFPIRVRVLVVPVRIVSGVVVGKDGIWFVRGFVSLSL